MAMSAEEVRQGLRTFERKLVWWVWSILNHQQNRASAMWQQHIEQLDNDPTYGRR